MTNCVLWGEIYSRAENSQATGEMEAGKEKGLRDQGQRRPPQRRAAPLSDLATWVLGFRHHFIVCPAAPTKHALEMLMCEPPSSIFPEDVKSRPRKGQYWD